LCVDRFLQRFFFSYFIEYNSAAVAKPVQFYFEL